MKLIFSDQTTDDLEDKVDICLLYVKFSCERNNGEVNMSKIVVFGVLGIVAVVGLVGVGSYISAYNTGNRMENNIKATYEDNEQILGQYGQKLGEAVQVPGLMKDDLKEVLAGAMAGRYGDGGSRAVFQMITENYPGQVDASLYVQVQRIIEAGRDEFKAAQTKLVDQRRQYNTAIGSFWQGTWMNVAGYPKINLGDYKPISTTRAESVFLEHKESAPIQLR